MEIEKKLKDLTKEEYIDWYTKNCFKSIFCGDCPLRGVKCSPASLDCWVEHKELYSDLLLEQKISLDNDPPLLNKEENTETILCIHNKYKVKIIDKYSYLNEDEEFIDDSYEKEEIMDGYELLQKMINILSDKDCIGCTIVKSSMYIQMFNPLTGESENYHLSFEDLGME